MERNYLISNGIKLKSLFYWKGILIIYILFQVNGFAQCTDAFYGQYPSINVTPNCNGSHQTIDEYALAGEFCKVAIYAGSTYNFSSSRSFDYITITNEDASVIYTSGITPVSWTSGASNEVIRYYLHNNSSCQISSSPRTKYISCSVSQPVCYAPQVIQVSSITSASALVSWNEVTPTPSLGYQYYLSTSNVAPTSITTPTNYVVSDAINITNLLSNTTYYIWVRSNCSSLQSVWSPMQSFTTTGGCTTANYGLYPTATFSPSCTGNFETITTQANAGEYSNISVISNKQYEFKSSIGTDFITITNANASIVYTSGSSPLTWLSGSTSGTLRFYIHTSVNCGNSAVNRTRSISCSSASVTCLPPSTINVTSIENNQAVLYWSAVFPPPSNGYQYYVSTVNSSPGIFSTPIYNTNELISTITGLNPNTTYYTWVRSFCGANNYSTWRAGPTFTTLSSAPSCNLPSNISATSISNTTATINWNASNPSPVNGYDYYLSTENNAPNNSTVPSGNVSTTSVLIQSLVPNTSYYIWVRSRCSSTNYSTYLFYSFTTSNSPNGCTTSLYGQYPSGIITLDCIGVEQVLTTDAKAGQFSKITTYPNKGYTYRSTRNTDFITITNEDASVIYTSGLTPVSWNSSSNLEIIRFYIHTNSSCGNENISRTKTLICGNNLLNQSYEKELFKLYPNPTSNLLTIQTQLNEFNYVIYSVESRIIKSGKSNLEQTTIDVSNLPSGLYIIEVKSNNEEIRKQKFIKK